MPARSSFYSSSTSYEEIPVILVDAEAARDAALAAQAAAEAAQAAAELAETHAETAETNAETAETNAETAETNAETAETNAAASASAAATNASAASTSASAASTSASAASTSATNAASSASAAATSASAASTSATNAASSASSASSSATSASASATAAANSATAAAAALSSAALKANNLSDLANASTARTNLGLGSAATLASSAVAQTANNLSDLASASTARTNIGLGTAGNPEFNSVNVGHASDTTVSRAGAGDIAVEGNIVYRAGGTDVPVTDGGTGASTASGARTNLGLGTSATIDTGASGTKVPLCNTAHTWAANQTFSADITFNSGTASTSTGTGAAVVSGGLGVSGAAYIGGIVNLSGGHFIVDPSKNLSPSGNAAALISVSGAYSLALKTATTSGVAGLMQFFDGADTSCGTILCDATDNTVSYNTSSDRRLKDVIGDFTPSDEIDRLRPVTYRWKTKPDGQPLHGFIAQEVDEVWPIAVTAPIEDVTDHWQLDSSKLMPLVIAELKALRARVKELEGR